MSGMVTWRETNVPDQVFGKVGVIDLFINGQDPELGTLVLGVKGLFGHDRGMIEFRPDQYDTLQDAQQPTGGRAHPGRSGPGQTRPDRRRVAFRQPPRPCW